MIRFVVRRVLLTIPVLVGVATLVFSLIHLIPGDPAQAMLGETASPQDVAELRARLGLDQPLLSQYTAFLKGAAKGDLGRSLRTNESVLPALMERMPATAELAVAAILVALVVAIPLGVAGNSAGCQSREGAHGRTWSSRRSPWVPRSRPSLPG